jgi:hypothetical protein
MIAGKFYEKLNFSRKFCSKKFNFVLDTKRAQQENFSQRTIQE